MSRISRKLLSCILGVIACFALVFGVITARPQTKTASAETAVTFSAANLGDASHDTYGTSIRFETSGVTFASATYYNWVNAADYTSIADYTTVNGRTVTEINNAHPDKQPITLMMQNGGSFSFLRLYIPAEIMPLDEVKSMGILDGWSFTDTKNGDVTYTSSAVAFLRTGNTMVLESSYTELNIVTPTLSDAAVSGYRTGESLGGDSWVVSIDLGTDSAYGEYDLMYDDYKYLRNAIYINGKSINEWNTQAIAGNPELGKPSTYLVFPQNSTDPTHLEPFVKPVGLWGNKEDDVVKLTILKALVADAEEIVVTVGAGACVFAESVPVHFMVKENVSKTVHTQTTKNITNNITCMTNTINETQSYAVYYIFTDYSEAAWTPSAMAGGCLGEGDITGKKGGQSLLKYVYFNGTSVWDINAAIDATYSSTQGNIVNGGVYAPIFATLSSEVGGAIKLTVPLYFAGLDENGEGIENTTAALVDNHYEIVLKRGLSIYDSTTGISSYLTNDIVFTNTTEGKADNTRWTKEIKGNELATEVTGIMTKANRTDGGNNENFVIFQLSNNDYVGCNTTAIADISSLYGYIDIGGTVIESYSGQKFFNVWNIANSVAFRFADAATLQNVPYITIKAGAKFPAYTTQNGGSLTYYVTQEDVTFIHEVPNDTWTVGTYAAEEYIDTSVSAIITGGTQYFGFQLGVSDYTSNKTSLDFDISNFIGNITYVLEDGTPVVVSSATNINIYKQDHSKFPGCFAFKPDGLSVATIQALQSITIKAGTKFPSLNNLGTTYYVTTEDVTFYQNETDVWSTSKVGDITSELTFHHQQTANGTETYLLKTQNAYWTKAPQGGCLNEYDPEGLGGGQEQMKYLYFNGTSLYDINKNDHGSYNSTQGNIASGGIYAPILVTMGLDATYSYIQLHVPTEYTNGKAAHEEFSIKAGFSVMEGDNTYTVTQDLTWLNLNGSWVNANNTFDASEVSIENPRRGGAANELYMVDIISDAWSITCNNYDFMFDNEATYSKYRKCIYINGVSVYDINANTDDSGYVYSTSPSSNSGERYAVPILIETYTGNYNSDAPAQNAAPTNKITLWIHENYMKTLSGEITVTLAAGYDAYTIGGKALLESVNYLMTATVTVDGASQTVVKGDCMAEPDTDKPMTDTTIYEFVGWYVAGTETAFDFSQPITEDVSVESRYTETSVVLHETELKEIYYHISKENTEDRWLLFYLSEHDYPEDVTLYNLRPEISEGVFDETHYEMLVSWGTFEKITLKGEMTVGGVAKTEATLQEIFDANGKGEAMFINIWDSTYNGTFAVRALGVSLIKEVIVEDGCFFPSYAYLSGATAEDTRYAIYMPQTFASESGTGTLITTSFTYDIKMAGGASVRIKDIPADFTGAASGSEADSKSGIRFETRISVADLDKLLGKLKSGDYTSVKFGTLIVTTSDLMGGQFNHNWLTANGIKYKDIECTAGFYQVDGEWTYAFPDGGADYQSFYGSLVRLQTANYTRWFSGLGYIKIVDKQGDTTYVYAEYSSVNSRSIAHVAQAAICDRSDSLTEIYKYQVGTSSYSRYTVGVNNFLGAYVSAYMQTMTDSGVSATQLDALATPVADTVNPTAQATVTVNKALAGAYVILQYSTNVNVRGKFYYQNNAGTQSAVEDFYLQAGTTEHKQFLDIYRYNGVGYGLSSDDLYMTKIEFSNVEFTDEITGDVKILGFYSVDREIPVSAQEIYLTVAQDDGSSMTVGAHLGLGGGLTYLAKSGIYEGVIGGSSGWKNGTVAISSNPGDFDAQNRYKSGSSSSSYSTEAGYYGSASGSLPSDGAVNLINNFDAGRQIQQSWYAKVGGSDGTAANGYTRAYCYTGSTEGQYWPYNPVQAGDVVSNPGQIIDYEVNTTKGYIYIKARAMDWAKGYNESKPCSGAVEGGVTTKSYVENYYRLNSDGTLYVNNAFVDWNGFTDMDLCDWTSTELPAVYPVHTLNYYVSNTNGDGSWTDALEYNNGLGSWTVSAYHQFADAANGDTKVEDWFAWANDAAGSIALGMYIPNVTRYTSGRSCTSTAYYTDNNFQNSNALPVDNYTEFSWSSFSNVDMVSDFAERGNILSDKGMMSNMQEIKYTYQSAYVSNTSYTAPGIDYRMEAYKPIDYTYVIAVNSITDIRDTFEAIYRNGTVTNAGQEGRYEKVGLDAWARADKKWTW